MDASDATTYSDYMVESTMQECLVILHEIAILGKVKTYSQVDFVSLRPSGNQSHKAKKDLESLALYTSI